MRFLALLLRFWVVIVFILLCGYFAIYNRESVGVHLPPWLESFYLPTYLFFMLSFLLGATVVIFFFGVEHMKKGMEIRRLNKKLRDHRPANSANTTLRPARSTEPAVTTSSDSDNSDTVESSV